MLAPRVAFAGSRRESLIRHLHLLVRYSTEIEYLRRSPSTEAAAASSAGSGTQCLQAQGYFPRIDDNPPDRHCPLRTAHLYDPGGYSNCVC